MADPLVLYYSGPDAKLALDARAGAELIRDRWPGAKLCPLQDSGCVGVELRSHDGPWWVLGLGGPFQGPSGYVAIDPTPDATSTMQVWGLLNPCEVCGGRGELHHIRIGDSQDLVETCDHCEGTRHEPAPTWLLYLDDAVCERWALIDSRVLWTYVMSFACKAQLDALKDALADGRVKKHAAIAGSAILRARKQWEEEYCCQTCGSEMPVYCEECSADVDAEEIARLRAERDALQEAVATAEAAESTRLPGCVLVNADHWKSIRKLAGASSKEDASC